jgi:hypothetical protein
LLEPHRANEQAFLKVFNQTTIVIAVFVGTAQSK